MKRLLSMMTLVTMLALPFSTLAQDATPAGTPTAQPANPLLSLEVYPANEPHRVKETKIVFPAATDFGVGWTFWGEVQIYDPVPGSTLNRYVMDYTSRWADRIEIQVVDATGRASQAGVNYDFSDGIFDLDAARLLPIAYVNDSGTMQSQSRDDLANILPQPPCDRMSRVEGGDVLTRYSYGASVCLDDETGLVVDAFVSGRIFREGRNLNWHQASDFVVIDTVRQSAGIQATLTTGGG